MPTGAKHTDVLSVRFSPAQRRQLAERADLCGRPLSTYVREVVLGKVPRARPGRFDQQAIYHLGRIGGNLNQIARTANVTGRIEETRRLREALDELLAALRSLV